MPTADAATQTDENLQPTRRPLSESSKKKYTQAIARLKDAGYNIETQPREVIEWVKKQGAAAAQIVYYSAIKYESSKADKPFPVPKEYQNELDRLSGERKVASKSQELTKRQKPNFVPFPELMAVQERLAGRGEKSDTDWKDYLIASLYTLQPPVRADYGQIQVVKKRSLSRKGNELIWGQKSKPPYFVFRVYKTAKTYGAVEVKVSPALVGVITQWFAHLGGTPKYLLGRAFEPADLLPLIAHAFRSTKKEIGVNLIRHAAITHFMSVPRTIKEREEFALKMHHDLSTQEKYAVASHLEAARDNIQKQTE
jgi:hypothetical protein